MDQSFSESVTTLTGNRIGVPVLRAVGIDKSYDGIPRREAGQLKHGDSSMAAGRLGKVKVVDDEVRLGAPFIFNKDNIDRFDF